MAFGDAIVEAVLGKVSVPEDTNNAPNVIAEGAAVNTTVGITAHSTFANGDASLDYSLSADSSGGGFKIDQNTGVVTVADPSKIDFESAPGHVYTITVLATKNNNFSNSQTFTISVNDVAPSAPVDSNAAANTVLEGAANGTAVGITASSTDVNGGAITYSLAGDTSGGGFTINATTGVVTVADGSKIDFESAPGHAYTVTVQSSDGTLTSSQAFTINVGDVAMTTPVDSNGAANSVAEGAAAGTTVGITASASDPSGPAPTYSLIGDTSAGGFTINASTGVVTVANPAKIDFESSGAGHSYNITVQASNGVQTTSQVFTVGVTDVAPSAPTDSNGAANTVVEGAANGTVVGVTAFSTDVNGPAPTYSLIGDTSGGGFTINSTTGVVTVADSTKINFETAPGHVYTVTARASDGTLSNSQTFTVAVTDVAPSAPVDSNGATNTVAEGAANGTAVGVTAFSTDINGPGVTYSLTGDTSGGGFTINSTTGVVTVADSTKLDFETSGPGHNYTVTATASDGTLTNSQTFTIAVTDVAPSAPTDINGATNTVAEGAANGSTVGITASSVDPNGPATTYSLTDSAGGRFAINSSSGVVTVANGSIIDFESAAGHAYGITVQATNGALTTSSAFSIGVTDVGPSTPTDTNGAANSVFEGAANGTAVGITAASADPGTGPTPTFSLTDSAGGRFTIDSGTGIVTVANGAAIDFETAPGPGHSYGITVQATAGALSTTQNFSIGVGNVNEAPAGTDKTVTMLEGDSYTFSVADFGFSDPSDSVSPNSLLAVKMTTVPGAGTGTFTNNGVTVNANDFVSATDIANGHLVFTPAAHSNGAPEASFTFQVQDNGGTANGGVDLDQSANTVTINVNAVNDAPVNSVPVAAQNVNEEGSFVFSAGTGNAITISDVDVGSGNETVTLTVTGGTLALGSHAGLVSFSPDNAASITLTGTVANVNAAMNGLTYTGNLNFNGVDTLTVHTDDNGNTGAGGPKFDSDPITINVAAVNDAPTATNLTQSLTINEDAAATPLFTTAPTVSDVDSTNLTATLTLTDPAAGVLTGGGFAATATPGVYSFTGTQAQVNAALAAVTYDSADNFNGTVNVNVTIDDGASGPQGTNPTGTVDIHVTAVNDAPTLTATGNNPNYTGSAVDLFSGVTASAGPANESTQLLSKLVLTVTNISGTANDFLTIDGTQVNLTDLNDLNTTGPLGVHATVSLAGSTATVTLTSAGLSDTDMQSLVDGLSYTDVTAPGAVSRVVTLTSVQDNGGTSPGVDTTTLAITSTVSFDAAPTITGGATISYVENDAATQVDNTIVVNDTDDTFLESATVKITSGFASGQDLLNTNTAGTSIGASFSGDTLTLTGHDTLAHYQSVLRLVTYQNTSEDPSATDRVLTTTVNDGTLDSTPITSTVHVAPRNDEPTLSATGLSPAFTENGSPVTLFSGANASTIEAGQNLDQIVLTVTNVAGTGASESLLIDGTTVALSNGNSQTTATHGLTASVALAAGTATITVSGGAISSADVNTLVNALAYGNSSEDPGAASRVVSVTSLRDTGLNGGGNDNINTALNVHSTVAVTPVNDAPTLTATSVGGTFTEPAGSALSAPTTGAVDLFSSPHASTIEAGQAFKQVVVTVSNLADTTEFLDVNGIAIDLVNGNSEAVTAGTATVAVAGNTATVTINATTTFTQAQVESLVDSLAYDNNDDTPTATSHTITVTSLTDNGGIANGGADTASLSLAASVTVAPTNDAPTAQSFNFTGNAANDAIGNTSLVLDDTSVPGAPDPAGPQKTINGSLLTGASDVDGPGPLVTVAQNNVATAHGHVTVNTNGEFSYTPNAGYIGTDTFNYQVSDQNPGTPGLGTGTVTVNVATPKVWYVNADAASDGDGTSANPFNNLSHFAGGGGVDGAGDTIFLYNATNHYTGGLTLENNEKLIGQSQGLTVNSTALETATGSNSGTIIEGGVVLGQSDTISGVTLGNTGAGTALSGTGFVTLNVDHTAVNTDNNGMVLTNGAFGAGATFTSFTSGGATDVSLTNVTGSVDLGTGTMSGQFAVSGGTVNTTYSGNLSQANNAAMVNVSGGHTGTMTFQTGTLNATNGTGLQFDNADGTYNFNGTNTLNNSVGGANANAGIDIVNGSNGNFSFSSNSSITGQTSTGETAFNVSGAGTGNITYAGTIGATDATDNAGTSVSVTGHTGGTVAFTGNILDSSDTGGGIGVSGNANTTINFSGAAKTLNTGIGDGVSMTNNTGTSNVNFTNGGLTVQTSNGAAFQDTVAGTVSVTGSGNTLATSGTGAILNMSDVALGASGVTFGSLQSTGTVNTTAVLLNNVDGNTFTSGGTSVAATSGAGNDGIRVSGGSSSTFNFNGTTTVSNTGNDGINLSGANGAVSFSSVALNGMTGDGVDISGNTAAVTLSAGSIGNTNDPAGVGVKVGTGTGDVSVAAAITTPSAGNIVDVTGHTGGTLAFSGAISATGGVDNGINLANNTGGTITFSNATNTLSTGANNAVDFTNSAATGAAVTFSGGNLDIDTTSGKGINATSTVTGAGSLTITGSNNTIASGTGTALTVDHTNIGASGLTFTSIASNGGSNDGIILNTTGSAGGLHVTGTGSAGSGGTIQNKTGADGSTTQGTGIYLNGTKDVQLAWMNLHDFDNFAVYGTGVNGFALAHSTVNGTNGNNASADEGSVIFDGLTGTGTFTSNAISGSVEDQMRIKNSSGNLNLNVGDGTVAGANTFTGTAAANDNLNIEANTTATITAHVNKNTFTGAGGDHIQANTINSATGTYVITNNTFTNVAGSLGGGVTVSGGNVGSTEHVNFNVSSNNLTGTVAGGAINVNEGQGAGTWQGQVANNTIGNPAVTDSGASQSSGIRAENHSTNGTLTVLITGNNVSQWGVGSAINLQAGDAGNGANNNNGVLNATVTSNTISNPGSNPGAAPMFGIVFNIGAGTGDNTANNQAWIDVHGNDINLGPTPPGGGFDLRLRMREASDTKVTQATPGSAGDFDDVNTLHATTNKVSIANAPAGTVTYSAGLPPQPTVPTLLAAQGEGPGSSDILTLDLLAPIVAEAIQHWADAGASAAQLALLNGIGFSIDDLPNGSLGQTFGTSITLDANGAGWGWFVDSTPNDNSEFASRISPTDLVATSGAAAGHMDLLTVVEHELGHVIGLEHNDEPGDVMNHDLNLGERRLPDATDVAQVNGTNAAQAAEAAVPVSAQAAANTPIVVGTAANDTIDAGHGGTILFGGAGADKFVFGPATPLDAPTPAQVTHVADYHAAEGDSFDFSAITSAFHNSSVNDSLVVRAVEDASGKFATLQVDHIDPMGLPSAPNWVNVAQLDGAHAGDAVNVLIDNHSVHLAQIHVDLLV
jgi:hypothetical protein